LSSLGYEIGATQSPIVPVVTGDVMSTVFRLWRPLFDEVIFMKPRSRPPSRVAGACSGPALWPPTDRISSIARWRPSSRAQKGGSPRVFLMV
jgi:hypothetical protein